MMMMVDICTTAHALRGEGPCSSAQNVCRQQAWLLYLKCRDSMVVFTAQLASLAAAPPPPLSMAPTAAASTPGLYDMPLTDGPLPMPVLLPAPAGP